MLEKNADAGKAVIDLLAIRLVWEAALYALYRDRIAAGWADMVPRFASPDAVDRDAEIDAVLQAAAERAGQRQLGALLASPANAPKPAPRVGPWGLSRPWVVCMPDTWPWSPEPARKRPSRWCRSS